jgi:hypothetical protein
MCGSAAFSFKLDAFDVDGMKGNENDLQCRTRQAHE